MDFVNKNFSGAFKIVFGILAIFVLIRIIPLLVVAGIAIWGGAKGIKYFKSWKNRKINKKEKTVDYVNVEKEFFDLSDKKIVDVDYEELK
ncbi:hypothetical protein P8V03_14175 [Clostridium sp. A1-XYC3]|uniref:ABC transporter n=1 Tax=Clostridium tanneri TaxID=3037988 RepID=A0ABU4JWJ6_9CLOT|nr:hypothetical protein [Clostridium sp. A1-XYC3]MDW8802298.1 hypothetical protein [Clostridium sp. A1-XYC3]